MVMILIIISQMHSFKEGPGATISDNSKKTCTTNQVSKPVVGGWGDVSDPEGRGRGL